MILLENQVKEIGLIVTSLVGKDITVERDNRLDDLKKQAVNKILEEWNEEKIQNHPILLEYRKLHTSCLGIPEDKYPCSPEYQLKYILKNKRFISINNIVDCYNLISLKYVIAVGSHDLDKSEGQFKFTFTNGTERFTPLGMTKPIPVPKGAYVFSDDNDVLCFLESRQADKTKITPQTKRHITYLQGNKETSQEYMNKGAEELLVLFQKYCKGSFYINSNS